MGKRSSTSTRFARDSGLRLKLFVAGVGPNSVRARANLAKILKDHLLEKCDLVIEDVLENPAGALAEGLVVTPILIRLAPGPKIRIVGDLSDTDAVVTSLGLKGVNREQHGR